MTSKLYHSFQTEDFLADEDFLRFVKYSYPDDVIFWSNWTEKSPENIQAYRSAVIQLKLILSDSEIGVSPSFRENLLMDINDSINEFERKRKNKRIRTIWLSGAASIILMATCFSWYFLSTIVVRADYAEDLLVHLPDGSEVRMNKNSTLSYARAFNWKARREVSLDGEAYFKVKHLNLTPDQIKRGELFVAVTNGVAVQVLGTEFNLKDRHHKTNVTLIKGKIQVQSKKTGRKYMLRPGELLDFDEKGIAVQKMQTAEVQTAWLSGKIIVNQTKVSDILQEFEDLYGYTVIVDNPALLQKKIDGAISIKSEESLLFTLKNILDVDVKKEGKTIYLKNRN
ncbi:MULTISPECIES: FecR family protein [unclassified Pedobacter]|uniref:FecR family protein n=1 Tax=unclassified Pedobacter TaxID=2628915 RepID=UPI001421E31A|nr:MULTISPECIES: FecR domain-containing protein [unclassified Pedobacter]NII81049.1 ferric-dicitrate binding protein FerR (iron transport regulator) [Pedobacter sp. SG908]NMN35067.1 ferric-dicitrate binding protein FerR (iron transport regulator) [Pedobacter sp. SG918]